MAEHLETYLFTVQIKMTSHPNYLQISYTVSRRRIWIRKGKGIIQARRKHFKGGQANSEQFA